MARTGMRLLFAFLLGLWASVSVAQDFPIFGVTSILIINQEALFAESNLGNDILVLEQQERDKLIEDGRTIGAAFMLEEQALTELRDTLPSDEFRALANAFDQKVEKARAEQETSDSIMISNIEARRRAFYQVIAPVLASLMQKYQATAIIDRRSVLLFDRNMDITNEAVDVLDQAYSDDPDMINLIGP